MSRSVGSVDECDGVLLRLSTDDSPWTATTSGDNAFGELLVYHKASLNAGRN